MHTKNKITVVRKLSSNRQSILSLISKLYMNKQQNDDVLQEKQDQLELLKIETLINGYFRIYVRFSDFSILATRTSQYYGPKLSIHWKFTSTILNDKNVMILKLPELYDKDNDYYDSDDSDAGWDSQRDWDGDREGIHNTLSICKHHISYIANIVIATLFFFFSSF